MVKFAKWLVALGAVAYVAYVGTVATKRYLAKNSAERVEAVQALSLRDNITVAELMDHLGDGVRTNDGVAWNTDGLRVYSVKVTPGAGTSPTHSARPTSSSACL
jgi:hypothetical protein